MGIFSFMKSAGQKLGMFYDKDEADQKAALEDAVERRRAKAMMNMVAQMGLAVEGLSIQVSGDAATVSGTAADQAVREKVVLAVGNTEGIASVDDRLTVAPRPAEPPAPPAVFYTVVKGDTLSKIAKQQYGNPNKYTAIFEANKPMLQHPDKIYPGQVLRIPPQE